jgi:hypothetical protein
VYFHLKLLKFSRYFRLKVFTKFSFWKYENNMIGNFRCPAMPETRYSCGFLWKIQRIPDFCKKWKLTGLRSRFCVSQVFRFLRNSVCSQPALGAALYWSIYFRVCHCSISSNSHKISIPKSQTGVDLTNLGKISLFIDCQNIWQYFDKILEQFSVYL